jgi:hypothetical protein
MSAGTPSREARVGPGQPKVRRQGGTPVAASASDGPSRTLPAAPMLAGRILNASAPPPAAEEPEDPHLRPGPAVCNGATPGPAAAPGPGPPHWQRAAPAGVAV